MTTIHTIACRMLASSFAPVIYVGAYADAPAIVMVSLPLTFETVSISDLITPAWSVSAQGLIQALPNWI
jgi:hypothetical protein